MHFVASRGRERTKGDGSHIRDRFRLAWTETVNRLIALREEEELMHFVASRGRGLARWLQSLWRRRPVAAEPSFCLIAPDGFCDEPAGYRLDLYGGDPDALDESDRFVYEI